MGRREAEGIGKEGGGEGDVQSNKVGWGNLDRNLFCKKLFAFLVTV